MSFWRKAKAAVTGGPSRVAQEIAAEFENGPLTRRDIEVHGISHMAIDYLGGTVSISMYGGGMIDGKLCEVTIHGKRSVASEEDAMLILGAANRRRRRLMAEDLAALEQLRRERTATQSATPDAEHLAGNQRANRSDAFGMKRNW